jgi:predicted nucleic acid-binding protein
VPVFVDTNVLVYARDSSERGKHGRAQEWVRALWETRAGRLSAQVLHEYYVTVTRKLVPGLPVDDARRDVRDLSQWRPLSLDGSMVEEAWAEQDSLRLSFWDALIVAAAKRAGCDRLLSEDLQHGQDLGGIVVVDPFRSEPADVLA